MEKIHWACRGMFGIKGWWQLDLDGPIRWELSRGIHVAEMIPTIGMCRTEGCWRTLMMAESLDPEPSKTASVITSRRALAVRIIIYLMYIVHMHVAPIKDGNARGGLARVGGGH